MIDWLRRRPVGVGKTNARRADPRQLSGARAQVCWWDRDGESLIGGTLADVSRGGVSLMVDDPPPTVPVVFVRVDERGGTEWVEARLLSVDITRRGPTVLHLAFPGRCPDAFLLAATEAVGSEGSTAKVAVDLSLDRG